jgi:hypothetical protein
MHILLALGVTMLAATQTQTPFSPLPTQPMSLTFIASVPFEKAISAIAEVSGVTIEFDQTVTEEARRAPVSTTGTVNMRNVIAEEAIQTLTKLQGLSYSIVNAKTVRIFKKG